MMHLIVALLLLFTTQATAQHNHAEGHNEYATWASQKANNCCNNMDCGVLNDDEWRETSEGTQVKISGQWCPVLPEHFIIRGKSPDWRGARLRTARREVLDRTKDALRTAPLFFWDAEVLGCDGWSAVHFGRYWPKADIGYRTANVRFRG